MGPPPDKDIVMGPPPNPFPHPNGASKSKEAQELAEKYSRLKKRYFELEQVCGHVEEGNFGAVARPLTQLSSRNKKIPLLNCSDPGSVTSR